jgi:8-oxo-dGTP diphosphatase
MYCYEYPRPALTVDCVIFGWDLEGGQLKVLLIERAHDPYAGSWAFPGGFVDMDETAETAARRELEEETGMSNVFMEQLYTFSTVERDPRGRVVSIAYFALVKPSNYTLNAASDAKRLSWFSTDNLPTLAFDHAQIMQTALTRLRNKVRYMPVGFELLPEKFTLSELQRLYEAILKASFDKRNFRKKILKSGLLQPLEEFQKNVPHRAAQLFKFDKEKYSELEKSGFVFAV